LDIAVAEPLEISGLVKTYRQPVLDHLDLVVSGGVFALLGPNGAGKTTLVSILTTLVRPDAGVARIGGVDVVRDPAGVRRLVTATGQETTIDDLLTGHENLVMLGRLLGLGARARARADELLEQVGLVAAARRRVSTYSGGMRRRLDLAASFMTQPYVLFLDEPTTGLDPVSRRRVWDDVRTLASTGTTVFLTTQTLDEAEALADRIAVLRQGTIVADGTAAELTALVGGQRIDLLDADGLLVHSVETDGSAGSVERALAALAPHQRGLQVSLHSPTLDDAFVALTRDHEEVAA
jgi:ABC-type multidrug transport system ATPase subunit